MTDKALIIFIKNPIKGKVKTRIAQTMGDDSALGIYLELSKITRNNALLLRGVTIYIFYADFIDSNDEWSYEHFQKHLQKGNDLGARMFDAFKTVLKNHLWACIIGSDCPTLSIEIIDKAFQQLAVFDTVLGPSTDGGYYLLGIANNGNEDLQVGTGFLQTIYSLFDDIAWSTDQVLPTTLARIEKNQLTVFLLPELTDIDEEQDWLNFQKNKQVN